MSRCPRDPRPPAGLTASPPRLRTSTGLNGFRLWGGSCALRPPRAGLVPSSCPGQIFTSVRTGPTDRRWTHSPETVEPREYINPPETKTFTSSEGVHGTVETTEVSHPPDDPSSPGPKETWSGNGTPHPRVPQVQNCPHPTMPTRTAREKSRRPCDEDPSPQTRCFETLSSRPPPRFTTHGH